MPSFSYDFLFSFCLDWITSCSFQEQAHAGARCQMNKAEVWSQDGTAEQSWGLCCSPRGEQETMSTPRAQAYASDMNQLGSRTSQSCQNILLRHWCFGAAAPHLLNKQFWFWSLHSWEERYIHLRLCQATGEEKQDIVVVYSVVCLRASKPHLNANA